MCITPTATITLLLEGDELPVHVPIDPTTRRKIPLDNGKVIGIYANIIDIPREAGVFDVHPTQEMAVDRVGGRWVYNTKTGHDEKVGHTGVHIHRRDWNVFRGDLTIRAAGRRKER